MTTVTFKHSLAHIVLRKLSGLVLFVLLFVLKLLRLGGSAFASLQWRVVVLTTLWILTTGVMTPWMNTERHY